MSTTRRDLMKRAGQAVAAGAALSVVPFPIEHTDTALFDLVRQLTLADEIKRERYEAWLDAIYEHLPPECRMLPFRKLPWGQLHGIFPDPHVTVLDELCKQAEEEQREIEQRIFVTPARTIGGIAAKLRIMRPNLSDLEQCVLADAERLAGRAT